jgi:hypothetical protein
MSESLRRSLRTLLQAGTAEVVVLFLEAFLFDFDTSQHAALLGALTVLCSFGHNALEESGTVPKLLKGPSGSGA